MTWRQSILKTVYPLLMLKHKLFPGDKFILLNKSHIPPTLSFYGLKAVANDGSQVDFSSFKGKKVLIVNTASDCGFTGQFAALEKLHKQMGEKLIILGFPANDFKAQEQKDDKGIAEFCKLNYGVSFPLMKKSTVIRGPEQNEVFVWLNETSRNGWCKRQPVWNFSKYLIDEKGMLVGFFGPTVAPMDEALYSLL